LSDFVFSWNNFFLSDSLNYALEHFLASMIDPELARVSAPLILDKLLRIAPKFQFIDCAASV